MSWIGQTWNANKTFFFLKCGEEGIFGEFMRNYAKIGLFRMRRKVGQSKEVDQFKSFGRVIRKNKANQISFLKKTGNFLAS